MKLQRENSIHETQRTCFFVACFSLFLALFAYIYFLSASVYHVVIRKELDREIASAHSEVSRLEAAYIDAQHQVSSSIASMEGFIVSEEKIFIDRSDDTLVLSTNNRR